MYCNMTLHPNRNHLTKFLLIRISCFGKVMEQTNTHTDLLLLEIIHSTDHEITNHYSAKYQKKILGASPQDPLSILPEIFNMRFLLILTQISNNLWGFAPRLQ